MKRIIRSKSPLQLLLYPLLSILFAACFSSTKKDTFESPKKFQIITPSILDTVYNKEYVAEIQSVQNVEIRARVRGFVEKILVDEGKPVKAGQTLFTLSSAEFKEDLLKAKALLKTALAELKAVEVEIRNTNLLAENNIVSKTEIEMLQAKKEAAQAKIDDANSSIAVANINLSFTRIKAPFTGVINRIHNKTGSLIDEGTLLTTISNNREVFAYFKLSESEYLDFIKSKGAGKQHRISLILANGDPFSQNGIIETTDNEIDRSSGNLSFRARFLNPEHLIKHGSTAKLLMTVDLHDALLIPQSSTFEVQENLYVFIVNDKNIVESRKIVPQMRLNNVFVVKSGLSATDKVLYDGIQLIKEGDKIEPELMKPNELFTTNK